MDTPQQRGMAPVLDDLNLDLLITVLSHTLLSPLFIIWIPILNFARGSALDSPTVLYPLCWAGVLAVYHTLAFSDRVHRSGGTLLLRPPRLDWGEQIVLVTGGASGVGLLLANTLAVRNVSVVVLDVQPVVSENYNIHYYKCDVSNADEVDAVAAQIRADIGDPTIIVNNAATVCAAPLLSLSPTALAHAFGTNTLAHFHVLRAFLPALVARNAGHVVTVSSVLALQGVAHLSAYCSSKAALGALHRSLRRELRTVYAAPGVRTTLLVPGRIHTPLFAGLRLPPNAARDFVAPALPAHAVVKRVIALLDEREGGEVYLPFFARCVPALEWVPGWARDALQAWTGADGGMAGVGAGKGEGGKEVGM